MLDLAMQYRGDNNGDLGAAWKVMQPRGWRSEETLQKAKRDLIDQGLILETRKGARPNKASLYAVTWCALDHCGGKPWEQSTGPKTIAGKATVSVNAYKGGTRSLLRQLAKLLK